MHGGLLEKRATTIVAASLQECACAPERIGWVPEIDRAMAVVARRARRGKGEDARSERD